MYKEKKIAFVFPGQGSQYIGMGMDLLEKDPEFLRVFNLFQTKTGHDLVSIMGIGPESLLTTTTFTQPATLAHSVMALKMFKKALKEKAIDLKADFVAGHSLGEFSALVSNEVLNFEDALYLVYKRGEFMLKANDNTPFAMAAVLGMEPATIKEVCEEASKQHLVVAANYNSPVQTVISGTKEGVELAGSIAKGRGAKKIMLLPVGGPFHSPLIKNAATWLSEEMERISFKNAQIPIISNIDASPEREAEKIKNKLIHQVTSPVQWVDTVKYFGEQSVDICIEFGPQIIVSKFIAKINENIKTFNIDKFDDIAKVISEFEAI
ncbi:MAG: ACP S-malonyltransferase [Candidatus Cloacimonetes bacterium]|nr:ACP S-malonyltransferase [Candidatus Cloacimonadota bacterium]